MTVKVIAECGVNFSNFEEATRMIDAAKNARASHVKFQLFNEDSLSPLENSDLKEKLKHLILDEQQIKCLKEKAESCKLGFILTPMYLEAVDIAAKYADCIKIRFADHENVALIDKALGTGKPVLISVPRPPIDMRTAFNPRVYSLYCIPKYPPEPEDFNLEYATACKGFSSHFPHTIFDLAFAINRNFDDVFIEKHVMQSVESVDDVIVVHKEGDVVMHPIDEAVSITFGKLKDFVQQLQLVERMKRIRL